MKKLLFSLVLLPFVLTAQIPTDYYSGTEDKKGAELKTILHNKIKGHTVRTYAQVWMDFKRTDTRPDGTIYCIWTDFPFVYGPASAENPGGQQQSTTSPNALSQFYNREHGFPASWAGPGRGLEGTPGYTDLFHMYPADARVNSLRNDNPYGEVPNPNPDRIFPGGAKLGANAFPGYSGTVFEPADNYKGDIARTIFYMVTRYEDLICGWSSVTTSAGGRATLNGTTYPALRPWKIGLLMKWHQQDPVSEKEKARNDSIFLIQGNRNPFIDFPEFVDSIWGYYWQTNPSEIACSGDPGAFKPFPEDFETNRSSDVANYNGVFMTFATGEWFVKGVTSMSNNSDGTPIDRRNGSRSVRLRGNNTDTLSLRHRIEMNFDKPNGIGTVSFNYGSFGNHSGGRVRLQVSTDGNNTTEDSWVDYGQVFVAPAWSGNFEPAIVVVDEPRSARIRIIKDAQSGSTTVNIDDINITDCVPELASSIEYLEFGTVAVGRTKVAVVGVFGANLKHDITYTLEGDNPEVFEIDLIQWTSDDVGFFSVIFEPNAEQTYHATLIFKSDDAEDGLVNLTGTGSASTSEDCYGTLLTLQSDTARLHADTLRLYLQVQALKIDTTNLNLTIATLQNEIIGHLEKISAFHIDTANLKATINSLNQNSSKLHDSVENLNVLLVEWFDINEILMDSIVVLLDTIESLRRQLADCKAGASDNVGVENFQPLQVFPNPVKNGELKIDNGKLPIGDIKLYDMRGKLVYQKTSIFNSQFSIDMSSYPSGNYMLRIGNRMTKIVKL